MTELSKINRLVLFFSEHIGVEFTPKHLEETLGIKDAYAAIYRMRQEGFEIQKYTDIDFVNTTYIYRGFGIGTKADERHIKLIDAGLWQNIQSQNDLEKALGVEENNNEQTINAKRMQKWITNILLLNVLFWVFVLSLYLNFK